jgi:hypothetical protein
MEALHGPAGQRDDSVTNLSWGTHAKNLGPDCDRDGTRRRGEQMAAAKLTATQAAIILSRRGENQRLLAEEYHVHQSRISEIQNGKAWKVPA